MCVLLDCFDTQVTFAAAQAQYEAFCEEELDKLQEKCQRQLQMIGSGHLHAENQTTVCNYFNRRCLLYQVFDNVLE